MPFVTLYRVELNKVKLVKTKPVHNRILNLLKGIPKKSTSLYELTKAGYFAVHSNLFSSVIFCSSKHCEIGPVYNGILRLK